jgi:carboxymethylenebutenolidase
MRAAYAAPDDGRAHPGVIVIHEIFGLNDDIRRITGRIADLGCAARTFLQSQPGVDGARIGVIGFCMGGGFALLYAARAPLGASTRSSASTSGADRAVRGS